LAIDKLKVDPAMDMFDFLDAVEQRAQTVPPLIRADTMTIYRRKQRGPGNISNTPGDVLTIDNITDGVNMDSSVLDSRTSQNYPIDFGLSNRAGSDQPIDLGGSGRNHQGNIN